MAKIKFRKVRLSVANKLRLETINTIIEEYQNEGYKLTLRQLYYQLVSRNIIPNKLAEYSKLSTLLKEGRMGGIVDWDAIEDRLRQPYTPSSFDSPKDIIEAAMYQYQLPRMKGQDNYIEVWVEKDALSGVLKRVTKQYHIPILVNRGYSSASAMYDAYNRFERGLSNAEKIIIFYLGDFDPSGMDMIRDVKDRIKEFFAGSDYIQSKWDALETKEQKCYFEVYIEKRDVNEELLQELGRDDFFKEWFEQTFSIIPIALTKEQIKQYNPPPNPAKSTDPRAKDFIAKHGATSWEVDALPPNVLNKLLEDSIKEKIDIELYQGICDRESNDKKKLKSLMKQL